MKSIHEPIYQNACRIANKGHKMMKCGWVFIYDNKKYKFYTSTNYNI